ncbi:MAG: putative Ig domain-containing protein [Acidobacteriota bacterium]
MRTSIPPLIVLIAGASALALGPATRVRMPISFVCNEGQLDPMVCAVARAAGLDVYASRDRLTLVIADPAASPTGRRARYVVSYALVDGSGNEPIVDERSATIVSYFHGPRGAWKAGLHAVARLRYPEVWPGVDLVVEGAQDQIKYTFEVDPGADTGRIRMALAGATAALVDDAGALAIATPLGPIHDGAPVAWQDTEGGRVPVDARYALDAAGNIGFELGCHDPGAPITIDPAVLAYSGFVGGSGNDYARAVAVDASGAAYVTGLTASATLPGTTGPDLTYNGAEDAFIAKVASDGTGFVYLGYIGGSARDWGMSVAVDTQGAAYVSGITESVDFPAVVGPYLTYGGGSSLGGDAFVTKVDPSGTTLEYSGFVGGQGPEWCYGIAVDRSGRAVIGGETGSGLSFPRILGPDLTPNGNNDAFVARVNPSGSALELSGFLGGQGTVLGVATDPADDIYVVGETDSFSGFPGIIGPDTTPNGVTDTFVVKVDGVSAQLVYSGFIGGAGYDHCGGVAVDAAGRAYVVGWTGSSETSFPVLVGPDLTYNRAYDAYVARVRADGTGLEYCGYIGGFRQDYAYDVAVDGAGRAYVAGMAESDEMKVPAFPVLDGPDVTFNGRQDAFVARLDPSGATLEYCGYVGGIDLDGAFGTAVDATGAQYVAGYTISGPTFPRVVGPDLTSNGANDAFVAKVSTGCAAILLLPPTLPPATSGQPYAQTLTASGGTPPCTFSLFAGALPPGLALSSGGVIAGVGQSSGVFAFTVSVMDAARCAGAISYVLRVDALHDVIVGQGHGQPNPNEVRVFDRNGAATGTDFYAYAAGTFGTNVSAGPIDSGGADRMLTGPGPGAVLGPQIRAFQPGGQPLMKVNFYAYGTLAYGVGTSGGDLDADGFAEIVTGAGPGAAFGPHVRAFDYDGASVRTIAKASFFAYNTLKYGVNVASGDVDGDGFAEIVSGPGPGPVFGPVARGWNYDGAAISAIATINFSAFVLPGYGLVPAMGDVDSDQKDEMAFAAGPGPLHPAQIQGYDYDGASVSALPGYAATPYTTLYGARLDVGNLLPDIQPRAELATGPGPDPAAPPLVKAYTYDGVALAAVPWTITPFGSLHGANVALATLGL